MPQHLQLPQHPKSILVMLIPEARGGVDKRVQRTLVQMLSPEVIRGCARVATPTNQRPVHVKVTIMFARPHPLPPAAAHDAAKPPMSTLTRCNERNRSNARLPKRIPVGFRRL